MKTNIDHLINRYQECVLHIRYACFPTPDNSDKSFDRIDDFLDVSRLLFRNAVLRELDIDVHNEDIFRKPINEIVVAPRQGKEVKLLVHRPSNPQSFYWDAFNGHVKHGDVTLAFLEWFDWEHVSVPIHQYCRVVISRFTDHPEFEGRLAMIDRRDAVFFTSV